MKRIVEQIKNWLRVAKLNYILYMELKKNSPVNNFRRPSSLSRTNGDEDVEPMNLNEIDEIELWIWSQ